MKRKLFSVVAGFLTSASLFAQAPTLPQPTPTPGAAEAVPDKPATPQATAPGAAMPGAVPFMPPPPPCATPDCP